MDSGVKNPFIYIRAFHVAPLEDGKPIISYLLPLEADPAFKQLFTFGYPEEVEESFWNMKVYFSLCDNDRMVVCCSSQGNNCITSFVFVMDIWTGKVLWYHKKKVSSPLPNLPQEIYLPFYAEISTGLGCQSSLCSWKFLLCGSRRFTWLHH